MLRTLALDLPLALSVCLTACAHAPGRPQSVASAAPQPEAHAALEAAAPCSGAGLLTPEQHIAQHGTVLDRYQIEGGVWLAHAPVLINRDFDFALAFAMEGGLGAGLAAAKRKEGNEKRAAALGEARLSKAAEEKLAALRCRGTHVYFVLWEAEKPVLRAVVDVEGGKEKSRVIEGEGAEPLMEAVEKLIPSIDSAAETRSGS